MFPYFTDVTLTPKSSVQHSYDFERIYFMQRVCIMIVFAKYNPRFCVGMCHRLHGCHILVNGKSMKTLRSQWNDVQFISLTKQTFRSNNFMNTKRKHLN